jgi:hypothetical protein
MYQLVWERSNFIFLQGLRWYVSHSSEYDGNGLVFRSKYVRSLPTAFQFLCSVSLPINEGIYYFYSPKFLRALFNEAVCRSASNCKMMVNTELENVGKEAVITLLLDAVLIFSGWVKLRQFRGFQSLCCDMNFGHSKMKRECSCG